MGGGERNVASETVGHGYQIRLGRLNGLQPRLAVSGETVNAFDPIHLT
jgi:hypothetical protein